MSCKSLQLFSWACVPDFTCTVIASSNESFNYQNLIFYLSPFLLKAQFVSGRRCVFKVLNKLNFWIFLDSIFSISSILFKKLLISALRDGFYFSVIIGSDIQISSTSSSTLVLY